MSKYRTTEASVEDGDYGRLFTIREVDEIGRKTQFYPLVSFGIKKAHAIIKHLDELKKYVEENEQ